jgi:hypothetical protein
LGERKKLWVVSPRPNRLPSAGTTSPSWWISGKIVREIGFQCSVIEVGITNWIFRVYRKP